MSSFETKFTIRQGSCRRTWCWGPLNVSAASTIMTRPVEGLVETAPPLEISYRANPSNSPPPPTPHPFISLLENLRVVTISQPDQYHRAARIIRDWKGNDKHLVLIKQITLVFCPWVKNSKNYFHLKHSKLSANHQRMLALIRVVGEAATHRHLQ